MTPEDQQKQFESWWDENSDKYMRDSCHMSEYHMAGVVWQAAQAPLLARIAELEASILEDW